MQFQFLGIMISINNVCDDEPLSKKKNYLIINIRT